MMRYSVIQMGARRKYAVPELLRKACLLESLFTDLCIGPGMEWIQQVGRAVPSLAKYVQGLQNRRVPGGMHPYSKMFPGVLLGHWLRSQGNKSAAAKYAEHVRWTDQLGRQIAKRGFGRTTHLYSMLAECTPALTEARKRGIRVVTEVYILLSADQILAEEKLRFGDWEKFDPEYEQFRRGLHPESRVVDNSDIAICPSEAVKQDLVKVHGFPAGNAIVIPYGVEDQWFTVRNQPRTGRVLFGGSAILRKGIHYFAAAAEELVRSDMEYQFRVVGDVTDSVRGHTACRQLEFTGRVSLSGVRKELEMADVLVLPSLAEGSAEIIYQALAAGVPVVTTPESGSVVSDGNDGLIVPSRDADALAKAIARLVTDRACRDAMSVRARETAGDYTWERYGERLLSALRTA